MMSFEGGSGTNWEGVLLSYASLAFDLKVLLENESKLQFPATIESVARGMNTLLEDGRIEDCIRQLNEEDEVGFRLDPDFYNKHSCLTTAVSVGLMWIQGCLSEVEDANLVALFPHRHSNFLPHAMLQVVLENGCTQYLHMRRDGTAPHATVEILESKRYSGSTAMWYPYTCPVYNTVDFLKMFIETAY